MFLANDDFGDYESPDESRGRDIDSSTHHEEMVAEIQESRDGGSMISRDTKEHLKRLGVLTGSLGGLLTAGKFYVENADDDSEGFLDFTESDENLYDFFEELIGADNVSAVYAQEPGEEMMNLYGDKMLELASSPNTMKYVNEALEAGSNLF
jgi:hypothetical protein